jgi:hypothetical protein
MLPRQYTFHLPRVTKSSSKSSVHVDPADVKPDDVEGQGDHAFNRAAAAEILKYTLESKYLLGLLSAVDLAELSYWLHHSGVPGFEHYKDLSPLQPSFNANACRSVRRELDVDSLERQYHKISLPMAGPQGRCFKELAVKPIYEALAEQFAEDPEAAVRLTQDMRTKNWVNNSILQAAAVDELVLPYGHFVDAAQFRGKGPGVPDSILVFNVNLACGAKRFTICTIRKEHLCGESVGCPCRGRCSLDVLERWLTWSAEHAATGYFPLLDFNNMPFKSIDRQLDAGQPIFIHDNKRVKFALVEFRADGAQYADLGIRRANQEHFCLKCHCNRAEMYNFSDTARWERWTDNEYRAVVAVNRISVMVSSSEANNILHMTRWDSREQGAHSRVVTRNIAGLVEKGWILMYGGSCMDVYAATAEDLQGAEPFELVFWRDDANELRCPLYVLEFPGARHEYLMLDDLHNLDLGVAARLAGVALLGSLILGEHFGTPSTEKGMKLALARMNAEISKFFAGRGFNFKKLTTKSLCWKNMQSTGHLKGKGVHCSMILPYVISLLSSPGSDFRAVSRKPLLKAVRSLQKAYELMRRSPRDIDSALLAKCLLDVGKFSIEAGVPMIPKFHYLAHFEEQAEASGNPKCCSTKPDESLHSDLVRMAQAMHTSEFSARILTRQALANRNKRSLEEFKSAWLNAKRHSSSSSSA